MSKPTSSITAPNDAISRVDLLLNPTQAEASTATSKANAVAEVHLTLTPSHQTERKPSDGKREVEDLSSITPSTSRGMLSTVDRTKEAVKKQFGLWNRTSNSIYVHQFKREDKDTVFELYWNLKRKLEEQLGREISKVRIQHNLGTITYEDESGKHTVDFLQTDNRVVQGIQESLEAYLNEINSINHYRTQFKDHFSPHSKGPILAAKGLISTSVIQSTYPSTMKQLYTPQQNLIFSMIAHTPAGNNREIIARRFLMLEEFYNKFGSALGTIINDLQSSGTELKMQAKTKAEEIKKLEELQIDLTGSNRFDATAVAITTGMYPTELNPSIERITQQAEATYNRLNSQLGFKDDSKKANETAWAKDVMGMFFFNRLDYADFCQRVDIDMKQERLEDWIVKFIINVVVDKANVKELKAFFINKGFSEEVLAVLNRKLSVILNELRTILRRSENAAPFTHHLQIEDEMPQEEKQRLEYRAFDVAAEDFNRLRQVSIPVNPA